MEVNQNPCPFRNIGSSEFDLPRGDGCFYQSIIQDVCFIRRPARDSFFPEKVYQDALTDTMALHYQVAHNKAGEEIIVVFQAISVDGRQAGVVQMSTLTQPLNDSLFRQISIFAVLSFAALVIGLFVFLPVIRLTLKPLSRIVRMMGDIHAGSLDKRLPIDRKHRN